MGKLRPLLLLAAAVSVPAQDSRPAYEAASIKVNDSGSGSNSSHGTKGQVVFTNQSLHRLIERAYNVAPFQVSGPDWLDTVRFDIAAKYPSETQNDDRPAMLRTLLEDRFKLAVHRETRSLPGYALVVAKGGLKLKPVDATGGSGNDHNGGKIEVMKAERNSMAQVADWLARTMKETVVDKTGIDGVYTFELRWTRDDLVTDGVDTAPTLATAIQETLGLRLQAQKVPVEVVVVDHIERIPIEN